MKLKIKFLEWSAGFPVVMINEKTADKLGVSSKERVLIKTKSPKKEIFTIIDTIQRLVNEKEIGVSLELKEILKLRNNQSVDVSLAQTPKSLVFIKKKFNGGKLSSGEIETIITDILANSISEAEIALFVSAMYQKGMDMDEIISLVKTILKTGKTLNFKDGLIADKHSIGGVPGNRTTPLVVSICSCAGLVMPKTSSRAITTAAGTADVIETIAKVEFSINEIKKILRKTKACMVWGEGLGMVPADSKIITIEKILGIDPEAQLLASIMSKKLAVGSKYILIDIPYGKNAKVNREKALRLKRKFEILGSHFHRKMKVVLTNGNKPIGNGIGPALELMDIIKILRLDKNRPKDLERKSLFLSGELLELTGKAKKGKGVLLAKEILESGKAFCKFKEIIKAQKGNINRLRYGKFKKDILSPRNAKISEIHNKKINMLARVAGCPSSKFSGLYLHKNVSETIKKGDKLLTIYSDSEARLREALKFYIENKPIKLS